MKKLDFNWFTEGLADFEYKKYILLAYLQHVNEDFKENKLYPSLAELVEHYRNLKLFEEKRNELYNEFPSEISELDFKNFRLVYEKTIKNDELMEEIEQIVNYSIPKFKYTIEDGRHRYEDIESHMSFTPVGILPLYKNEGYLLIKNGPSPQTQVYQYRITIFENADERFRGIRTTYVKTYRHSLLYTFQNIKNELAKEGELPNPATYLAESGTYYPLEETLLPIAGRILVRTVN